MNGGDYDSDVLEMDESLDTDEDEAYDQGEVDEMLDALIGEQDEDYAERRRRRSQNRKRAAKQRKGVPTAKGRSAYQEPGEKGFVTQKQFKEALARVGEETKRNAEGIKTVNTRFGKLDSRIDGVVSVSTLQSGKIRSLDTRMRIDGALDFAQSFNIVTGDDNSLGLQPDFSQMLRGAVKNGVLGNGKGALSNPWVIGGIALVIRNPGIVGGLLAPRTT
jgi:hypothetical protein